jgi:two-component system, OmpR family, response regulator QseB
VSETPRGHKIVLIEDDTDIAALIEETLADAGHVVDVRPQLAAGPVDLDATLVVTDLVNLVRGYDQLAARNWVSTVRARFPRASVIVMTAHASAGEDGASALGADAVVTKPFDIGQLTRIVESLLDR